MRTIITNQDRRIGEWVCDRTDGVYTEGVCIGLEEDGKIIAGILYDHYNKASIAMHVAGEGRWMTKELLWFAFYYPFEQLKVRKVIGMVPSENQRALAFDKHLGFVEEARITDATTRGDLVLLTMTKSQCRYLERKHGRKEFTSSST